MRIARHEQRLLASGQAGHPFLSLRAQHMPRLPRLPRAKRGGAKRGGAKRGGAERGESNLLAGKRTVWKAYPTAVCGLPSRGLLRRYAPRNDICHGKLNSKEELFYARICHRRH